MWKTIAFYFSRYFLPLSPFRSVCLSITSLLPSNDQICCYFLQLNNFVFVFCMCFTIDNLHDEFLQYLNTTNVTCDIYYVIRNCLWPDQVNFWIFETNISIGNCFNSLPALNINEISINVCVFVCVSFLSTKFYNLNLPFFNWCNANRKNKKNKQNNIYAHSDLNCST